MDKHLNLRQSTMQKLNQIDSLPALPGRFHLLQEVLDEPSSSLSDLAKVIEADQAITATILKVANSIYYNPLGKPVSNLPYAISRLGRKEAGDIALSMALLSGIPMPANIIYIQQFWSHAFIVGHISRYLATSMPTTHQLNPDTIFISSLLHDIGRAILGICIDSEYFKSNLLELHGQELIDAEFKSYGVNHAEVGEVILRHWKLPPEIHETVGAHHDSSSNSLPVRICMFADDFAHTHLQNISSIEEAQNKLKSNNLMIKVAEEAQEKLPDII